VFYLISLLPVAGPGRNKYLKKQYNIPI